MNITDQIIADPSGGTASLEGRDLPSTGYFVGGLVSPLILDDSEVIPRADLDAFIAYVTGSQVAADYIGWWTDEETGKLWVDATSWHANYDDAEAVTRARNEIAFYDIELQREFRPVARP